MIQGVQDQQRDAESPLQSDQGLGVLSLHPRRRRFVTGPTALPLEVTGTAHVITQGP
jgi:hypothetical protein